MKVYKPGQFAIINGILYRAKRREYGNCTGCALDSVFRCPNVTDVRALEKPLQCSIHRLIFVKV